MSTFDCPHCEAEHDISNTPDYFYDMKNNRFTFECDCGATYECHVDWEPEIYVREDTLRLPPKSEPCEPAQSEQGAASTPKTEGGK